MKTSTIQGFEHYTISENGEIRNSKTNRVTVSTKEKTGYIRVNLNKDKQQKRFAVHRLLAIHFIPNPNNYPHINHIDGVKDNNELSNLEWCTRKQNAQHAVANKLWVSTDKHKKASSKTMSKYCDRIRKPVVNIETGVYYDSISEAADSVNMKMPNLANRLNGKYKNKTPFRYA